MKTLHVHKAAFGTSMALVLALMLTGCAGTPDSPSGSETSRSNLTALQSDRNLANRAPMEMREAEEAVLLAEQPLSRSDASLAAHRVYMADHKVEIARAKATTSHLESQRDQQRDTRDSARLASRTAEADKARRGEANLQRQLDAMQAKPTDRGIVLVLGDVQFATGSSELRRDGDGNLNRLVEFLKQHPDRTVTIEGHTDSVGNANSNQQLSEQRANAVRTYLVRNGIPASRLTASGMGEGHPIGSNTSEQGRQQNRRVEVVIADAPRT